MREKLIELLNEAEEWADHKCDELECETCPADKMKSNCVQQLMVDRLIANGVTISNLETVKEWIPVTERLPDRNDIVIAFYPTMRGTSGEMQIHKAWAMSDTCTHWMPLPEAPKGE